MNTQEARNPGFLEHQPDNATAVFGRAATAANDAPSIDRSTTNPPANGLFGVHETSSASSSSKLTAKSVTYGEEISSARERSNEVVSCPSMCCHDTSVCRTSGMIKGEMGTTPCLRCCNHGLIFVYYLSMLHLFSKYAVRPAGLLLVLVFMSSLVWCGDEACWSGTSDGQCASLICTLFANHDTPNENHNGNCSTQCMCACHMPTILGIASDTEHHLTAQITAYEFTTSTPSSPTRSIYHPPKS